MNIKNIINKRKENNLTQQEIANKLGITKSCYSNYEMGIRQISIEILIKLSQIYQVTVDYLLGLEPDSGLIYVHKDPALTNDEKQLLDIYRKIPFDKHRKAQRLLSFTFTEEIENEAKNIQ